MMEFKTQGLVTDLMPNIRLMQASGHFLFNYHADNSGALHTLRIFYSCVHLILILLQFGCIFGNLVQEADDVNDLAANTITILFFTHCVTKFVYFAIRSKLFYRTLGIWNSPNSHPLFVESNNRYHSISLTKMRRVLMVVLATTLISAVSWTTLTFIGDSTHTKKDPNNENETITEEIPRLLVKAWYPWNAMSGMPYMLSLVYQVYYVLFSMLQSNLMDVLFCSWLIFACEQLKHLKAIMKPLMELSATLDTYVPKSADLFRANSAKSQDNLIENDYNNMKQDYKGVYNTQQEMGVNYRSGALQTFGPGGMNGGIGPNGLTKKQEMMVRSAIKYWVERHKHVVRLVTAIGDAYGVALLFHMLTSTITLTLLAYQATKIDGVTKYAASVIGYLLYALAQVFLFCIFGNQLIEESSSVMEAAYSCHWYDGSEEAKTFVQIVCQQCQKALSISGAKFFTISLDLFASVLGATVTYFMVLVQLK
ncbi:PREDICTED: odorant receptor coreceptor [Nicrophorus vespilloides]|uniref:Odorant receptor n=1 Tax=Nicrophorus vespilloides TaxID=110193 RepID=A0ABM1NE59_NICVS|nr:PREDICTED: odorant receptor coreceptor [Nicrophorus vespilloides]